MVARGEIRGRMSKRTRSTLKESVYASLRAMILTGELQPGGRLTEGELAQRLKVSRTPLREALNRLERDGLVTNRPRHGYAVSAFDLAAFEDAFDVRAVLDGYAAERATETITPADQDRLRAMVRQCEAMAAAPDRSMEDLIEEMHVGLEVHRVIARASGNALLAETLSRILDRCQYFVWLELLWLDEWAVARREHAAIVEAICAGDGARAAELARKHVQGSRNNILRFLKARSAYRDALVHGSGPGAAPGLEWPRAPSASMRLADGG
jgi:DNA-binding GntR family transcriptional regulator